MERIARYFSSQLGLALRTARMLSTSNRGSLASKRFLSSETTDDNPTNEKPIAYTKSRAFNYKASKNFRVSEEEMTYPSYTSFVLKVSILIFLTYFCILREPNDVDEILSRDLFETVPDLEIPMLEVEVKRLEAHGVNADDLKQKVAELKHLQNMTSQKKI